MDPAAAAVVAVPPSGLWTVKNLKRAHVLTVTRIAAVAVQADKAVGPRD